MEGAGVHINLVWNAPAKAGGFFARIITGRLEGEIGPRALAQAFRWRRRLRAHSEDDAEWNWTRFLRDFSKAEKAGRGIYAPYSLWALDKVQALMILEISGQHHLTRESGWPQVYVEYLSVSPDNRSTVRQPRRVLGCGSALLAVAVDESVRRGWNGRVGLHSLPGAVGFYMKQGFADFGRDPREEGCHYMERSGMLKRS